MKYTDEFEEFWKVYPRKDNKIKAAPSFARLNQKEKALAIKDCAKRYKGRERQFIPMATTYINAKSWENEGVMDETEREAIILRDCAVEGCSEPIHGPCFNHCINHLPEPSNPVLDRQRAIFKERLTRHEGESLTEYTDRLRRIAKSNISGMCEMPAHIK